MPKPDKPTPAPAPPAKPRLPASEAEILASAKAMEDAVRELTFRDGKPVALIVRGHR